MSNDCDRDVDDPQFRPTPGQQMLSSCTGAFITSFFVTPLDVVKIRLQAQQKAMLTSRCYLYCNGLMDHICGCGPVSTQGQDWLHRPGHFNGTIDAFIKISRNEGISSLWSGLSPTLVLSVPATIVYFVSYEQLRLTFKDYYNRNRHPNAPQEQPLWIPSLSGSSARIIAATIISPLELVRTKMQSTRLTYAQVGEALKLLMKTDGVLGLWKGLGATLLRDVPFSAIYWTNYEFIKSFGPPVPTFGYSFFAGAIAGTVAATCTVPFDVVKTHQQIELGEKALYTNVPKKTNSTAFVINEIYSRSGVRGLFTGLTPRIIKVAPACAIMIATFEYGKQMCQRYSIFTSKDKIEKN